MNEAELYIKIAIGLREQSPDNFQKFSLDLIKPIIGFDSACWVDFTHDFKHHHTFLYEQPESFLTEFEPFQDQDISIKKALESKNKTLIDSQIVPCDYYKKNIVYNEFFKPHKVHDALFTVRSNKDSNILTLLALYRESNNSQFSEKERKTKELFTGLLLESWKNNILYQTPYSIQNKFIAVYTLEGKLIFADSEFIGIYNTEFYTPNTLHEKLKSHLQHIAKNKLSNFPYFTKRHIFNINISPFGFIYISVKSNKYIQLSQTQSKIAYLYSILGLTQKHVQIFLNMSPSAVKRHLETIRIKYNISTKQDMRKYFLEELQK